MNRATTIVASLYVIASVAACDENGSSSANNSALSGSPGPDDAESAKQTQAAFLTALARRDFAAVKENYANDAVMMQPSEPVLRGIQAISTNYDRFARDAGAMVEGTTQSTVVSSSGDLAFSEGTYRAGYTNPKTHALESGSGYFLIVYRKQPDGSWKIIRDVSSPLPNQPSADR